MVNIYTDSIEVRVQRIYDGIAAMDYEGVSTVMTSDLVEITNYMKAALEIFSLIKTKEESDSGNVFSPTYITSCRTHHMERLKRLLPRVGII